MPFAKRTVEPQRLLRRAEDEDEEEDAELRDLSAFSNLALSRSLRQLSDLAKHACSLFQELEHELVSTNLRVCALRQKMNVLQARTGELDPKQEASSSSSCRCSPRLSVGVHRVQVMFTCPEVQTRSKTQSTEIIEQHHPGLILDQSFRGPKHLMIDPDPCLKLLLLKKFVSGSGLHRGKSSGGLGGSWSMLGGIPEDFISVLYKSRALLCALVSDDASAACASVSISYISSCWQLDTNVTNPGIEPRAYRRFWSDPQLPKYSGASLNILISKTQNIHLFTHTPGVCSFLITTLITQGLEVTSPSSRCKERVFLEDMQLHLPALFLRNHIKPETLPIKQQPESEGLLDEIKLLVARPKP
ncbi:hypothetical protein DNTS_035556 [Danionella cerebrum]|uniref:Uncharacterized protein n=1 Tax=Danionella cerebrum TaxID=2873325 RepID=A0A553NRE0_9TELE|nr:hypothetical protein DNTS_035556 [Danionella translucida]